MARRQVTEIQCSRCPRKDVRPLEEIPAGQKTEHALVMRLQAPGEPAKEIVFEDLCGVCARTVAGHMESISKALEGLSPDRKAGGKKKGAGETPSSSS
jgi:hypothetical protein